ncbi:MAG: hypothetical protein LIP12_09270 [Clostridiales bacterium]|nr:hypothetical protein [Clostridiales bacterium]
MLTNEQAGRDHPWHMGNEQSGYAGMVQAGHTAAMDYPRHTDSEQSGHTGMV